MPSQNISLWYSEYFDPQFKGALGEQWVQGETLSELPSLPKDRPSKRNSAVTNTFSRVLSPREY
jgi:hypothetical protein